MKPACLEKMNVFDISDLHVSILERVQSNGLVLLSYTCKSLRGVVSNYARGKFPAVVSLILAYGALHDAIIYDLANSTLYRNVFRRTIYDNWRKYHISSCVDMVLHYMKHGFQVDDEDKKYLLG